MISINSVSQFYIVLQIPDQRELFNSLAATVSTLWHQVSFVKYSLVCDIQVFSCQLQYPICIYLNGRFYAAVIVYSSVCRGWVVQKPVCLGFITWYLYIYSFSVIFYGKFSDVLQLCCHTEYINEFNCFGNHMTFTNSISLVTLSCWKIKLCALVAACQLSVPNIMKLLTLTLYITLITSNEILYMFKHKNQFTSWPRPP